MPRWMSQELKGSPGVPSSMATGWILSHNACVVVMEPPMASLWPFKNFVRLLITISAPKSIGRMAMGVVKVLSTMR